MANLNRLRHLREQHNLSQRALAEALGAYDNEEFDPKRISVYETGKAEPDIETLDKLAHFFGVTVDYLIGRETTVFPKPEDSDFGQSIPALPGCQAALGLSLIHI